jgi:fatty-acyl-CoA synthase
MLGACRTNGSILRRGYWDEPDLTAASSATGMHSGAAADIRDIWFYVVDRLKDIIIQGGQNIACKEVEEAL